MNEKLPTKEFVETITRKAGEIVMDHQQKIKVVADRGFGDRTTQADLASESYLKEEIKKHFPTHQILAASILNCSLLEICYVAAGKFDAGVYRGGKPWDWAAVKVIIEEAGGVMTELDGSKPDIFHLDHIFSNGKLHEVILKTKL